ncbi:thioredoxin-like protein [Mycena albidolilacea]|uniref:glutathione transferase n=1 Tax=Mycena albidolilacea TaxID=1033008 RepID=A0AAD7EL59_9AGAR|nr:thioredoxin-like protein [Mycena albidolilacea]
MIVVHHLQDSRSQRILWLLEELGTPYQVKTYQRTSVGLAPKALLEVTPLGKSPVITDGDVTLAESTAIVDYLISKYAADGKLQAPSSGPEYLNNLYFMHFAEGSLMPLIVERLHLKTFPRFMPQDVRPTATKLFGVVLKQRVEPEIRKYAALVEAHLETVDWFAGGPGPTAADFAMSFPLECLALLKMAGPKSVGWVAKIQARPAYLRALDKGEGRYAYKL